MVCHYWPTCLSMGTETDKRRNTVDACGAGAASRCSTVINVLRAVRPTPAINTHTHIAAYQVAAGPSVLASVWLQAALIYIFCTVLACRGKKGKTNDLSTETIVKYSPPPLLLFLALLGLVLHKLKQAK